MLEIYAGTEEFDEETEKFVIVDRVDLQLEHSLVSASKWESKFQRPFISDNNMQPEEIYYLLWCMCLTPNTPPEIFLRVSDEQIQMALDYLSDKQSATFFNEERGQGGPPGRKQIITTEVIYSWMFMHRIPIEAEHWNLNRLMNLIRILDEKHNSKSRRMSPKEIIARNRELNQQRRAASGSAG